MPGCVLRVIGDDFSPNEFLATASLKPYIVFQKGVISDQRSRPSPTSGFNCEVSSGEAPLKVQIEDAIEFMNSFAADLKRLAAMETVESRYLDFGYSCRLDQSNVCVQKDYLPNEFLRLAGELSLGVCLTLYPQSDEKNN